jgi:hypothetical protein
MAKLRKLKPGKREIIASLVIFGGIALLLALPLFSAPTSAPGLFAAPQSSLGESFPGVQDTFSPNNTPNNALNVERVVNTSESLLGELKHNHFENTTAVIISNLTSMGGYVASSNLMYNGTTWFGLYNVEVPSGDATQFLFQVTNLVNANGETQSVNIQTQDVTNATGGNQSKVPYSAFSLTLQEEAQSSSTVHPAPFSDLFGTVGSLLGVVLGDAAYVVLIAVPIYLLILGGVLLSGRVLYPIFLRVFRTSSPKQVEESSSHVA